MFAVLLLYLRLVVAPMISWCSSGVYHWGISASSVTSGVAVSVSFCSFCRDKTYQYNVSYRILISKLCVNSVWPGSHIEAAVEFTSVAHVVRTLAVLSALALASSSCASTRPKFTFSVHILNRLLTFNGRGTVSHPAGAFRCSLNCHLVQRHSGTSECTDGREIQLRPSAVP